MTGVQTCALPIYLKLSENGPDATPEMVLEIPQLMLSFEEKEFVEKEDREIMKKNGVVVKGKNLLPVFRSYKPGMVPWFLEEGEQVGMINYLDQFLEVCMRTKGGKAGKQWAPDVANVFPVRECIMSGESIKWHDTKMEIHIPADIGIQYVIDPGLKEKAKVVPPGKDIYEIDFFLTPAQVKEKNKRPFFSYMLLLVDQKSGMVLFNDILDLSDGINEMLAKIPGCILKALSAGKTLPQAVFAGSPRLSDLLSPLLKSLGIKLQYKHNLRSLENAKMAVFDYFNRD